MPIRIKKLSGIIVSIAIALCAIVIFNQTALAYKLLGGKWQSFPIYYLRVIDGTAGRYPTLISNAVVSWNATPTKTRLYLTTQDGYEKTTIHAGYFGDSAYCDGGYFHWNGCTELYPSKTSIPYQYGNILINRTILDDPVGGYSAGEKQGVIAHEIGHVFGLGHVPSTPPTCVLMYPDSSYRFDSCGLKSPRQDDINGIKSLYP